MKTTTLLSIATVISLATAVNALAWGGQGQGRGQGRMNIAPHAHCFASMQLNDEQKSALEGLKQDASPEHLAAREAFRSEMNKLRDLRRKGGNQEDLAIQKQAVDAARERLDGFRDEHQAQLKTILTPEQFSAFEACTSSKDSQRQHRMERKMGRGMEKRGGN